MSSTPWYQVAPPPPSLAAVLACTWTAEPSGRHRLVPDACLDLLWLSNGQLWLCGPEVKAWTFQLPTGITAAGVRFRPGVVPALFGVSAHALLDRRLPWAQVVGSGVERKVARQLALATDPLGRVRVLEHHVAALAGTADGPDPFAEAVLLHVAEHPRVVAAHVASAVGLTTRQLHRRCLVSFGYGVATLARIVRFHRFWSAAHLAPPGTPLTVLAHAAGYADHAHLARDCRAITGSAPSRFLRESFATFPDMSDPYKTGPQFSATLVS